MSSFVYVLAEGVHDVAFLGKLLTVGFDAKRIKTMEELDKARRDWMASFKWPLTRGGKIEIDRLAVPAPVFHRLPAGTLVALRNAQGLTNVHDMLERDLESFDRDDNRPDSIGVVLDSDEEPADARFRRFVALLQEMQLTAPSGARTGHTWRTARRCIRAPGAGCGRHARRRPAAARRGRVPGAVRGCARVCRAGSQPS